MPGVSAYGIYQCQTTNDGDPECAEAPYDTVDAFQANPGGDLLAHPGTYTDIGSPVTTPPALSTTNQTGNVAIGGIASVGQPPMANGQVLSEGNSVGQYTAANLPTYLQVIKADSPGGCWAMGEASGNIADSCHSNTGTPTGSPTYSQTGPVVNDATAISLGTVTALFSIATDASLPSTDLGSWEVWYKATAITGTRVLMAQGVNGAFLELTPNTNQVAFGKVGFGTLCASSYGLTDTTLFHHIVATKNGAACRVFIDGVDVTTPVNSATISPADASMTIGQAVNDSNGTLGWAAVYKTALSAASVAAHFHEGGVIKYGRLAYDSTNKCISTYNAFSGWACINQGVVYSAAGTAIVAAGVTNTHAIACVSDETSACTRGNTYASGGANKCGVQSDGSNWKVTGAGCF